MNPVAAQKPINYQEVITNKIKTWDKDKLDARVTAEVNKILNNKNLSEIEQKEQVENLKKISQKIEPRTLQNPEEIVKALQEHSDKFTPEDINQIIAMRRIWQESLVDNKTIDKLNSTLQKSLSVFANLFKMNQAIMPKELTYELLLMLSPEELKNWEENYPQITQDVTFKSKFLIKTNQVDEYAKLIAQDLVENKPLNETVMKNLFSYASLNFQTRVWVQIHGFIAPRLEYDYEKVNEMLIKFAAQIPSSAERLAPLTIIGYELKLLETLARFWESPGYPALKEIDLLYFINKEIIIKLLNNCPNLEKIRLIDKWEQEIIQELKKLKNLNTISFSVSPGFTGPIRKKE